MLTVCTAHLGFAIETYPTWRHESRCPSEEKTNNENSLAGAPYWKQHAEQKSRGAIKVTRRRNRKTSEIVAKKSRNWPETQR